MELLIEKIAEACGMSYEDAQAELETSIDYLATLAEEGILRPMDVYDECAGLGLDDWDAIRLGELATSYHPER